MLIVVLAAIGIGLYLRNQERTIELQPTAQPTSTPAPTAAEEPAVTPEPTAPDYDDPNSWAYFALGEDRGADVFIICPTVDTRSERNSFDLNDKLKGRFVNALDMEKGIFEDAGRLYSPYYRQMSINAYRLPEADRAEAKAVAYGDVSAAFRWYLNHENGGRHGHPLRHGPRGRAGAGGDRVKKSKKLPARELFCMHLFYFSGSGVGCLRRYRQ